jgi:hypothetical protein
MLWGGNVSMKMRISNLLLLGLIVAAALFFFIVVNESYYLENNDLRIGADSTTYYTMAKIAVENDYKFEYISLGANSLGPIFLLVSTNFNNLAVFFINSLLLVVAYISLVNTYEFNRKKFIFLLALNPMLIASLLLVNKEVLGLFGLAMFACYLKSKSLKFLVAACLFALMTRWQQFFIIVIYLLIVSPLNPLRNKRAITIGIIVFSISLLYPIFLSPILGRVISADTVESQANSAWGLISILNALQDNYLFFVALVPKILSNLFGNVFRILQFATNPSLIDYNDFYNNFVVLGHQITMLAIFIIMIKERRVNLNNDIVYFSLIYLIFFSVGLMIQYRYIFPLYILFCMEVSKLAPMNQKSNNPISRQP